MCTALSLQNNNGSYLFGRNMDIDYYFNQNPMIIPRGYQYQNRATKQIETTKYALMGMGIVVENLPLFAEVQNEKGLACAGLNFPSAVWSSDCKNDCINMPPYHFPLWVTGNFESTDQVLAQIEKICLVGVPVNEHIPLPTLHFMVCDKSGKSIVIETAGGTIKVHDNPVGVMTNAPAFDWHLTNLRNYLNLSNHEAEGTQWGAQSVSRLGTGTGLMGIPGDFSSVSRFVRAAFFRNHIQLSQTKTGGVSAFFHILDNLAMIKGSVTIKGNNEDYTSYSSCMDLQAGKYYFKTYDNQQVRMLDLFAFNLSGKEIMTFTYEAEETFDAVEPIKIKELH